MGEPEPKVAKGKTDWILPNRFLFTKWIYKKFHPSKYTKDEKAYFNPDPSQKLIRDYMNFESPYRGILVYHGLGTGKTCSAILAADSFVNHHRKVIVILPASLENNYRRELGKCSRTGSILKGKWTLVQLNINNDMDLIELIREKTSIGRDLIRSTDGLVWLPSFVTKTDFPSNKILEANVSYKVMNDSNKRSVERVYNYMVNNRYTFLHYNGMSEKQIIKLEKTKNDFGEDIFDNSLVVIDEVHSFISRVVNGGKVSTRLYNILISKKNIRLILLSGTPVINHPFELAYTLNLLRGPITEYVIASPRSAKLPSSTNEVIEYLQREDLYKHIDTLEMSTDISITLLPKGFVREKSTGNEIVSGPFFASEGRFMNTVANSLKKKYGVSASFKSHEYTVFPDKKDVFIDYFFDNSKPMEPMINPEHQQLFMKRILGLVSYYRIADEEMFPTALEPIYMKVPMSDAQFNYYAKHRNEEIKKEEIQRKRSIKRGAKEDLFQKNSSFRAYSRMACNFVFPKEIERPFPKNIRLKILRGELDFEGDDEAEAEADAEAKDEASGKDKKKPNQDKEYEKAKKQALTALNNAGGIYLKGNGLAECSPKMAQLLKDLTRNTFTKSLLYSQFRTVEGLHIFRMVLDHADWVEIDFKQLENNDWEIVNAEVVLDPKYDHKRYMTFGVKEKTDILIGLFNADFKVLPNTVQQQLKAANYTENLRGKLAALLMITQSGAEGLNLRNVRHVYILEPFWNQVRIDQVIGRAIRKGSHLELPEEDRNVQVVMYISSFTSEQAVKDNSIKMQDNSLTTDQNVRETAMRKNRIIEQFLTLLKASSIDCIFHAPQNKPLFYNYKCYIPPTNADPSGIAYLPNIEDDLKNTAGFGIRERLKKIKGLAVKLENKPYVKLLNNKILYDYNAYKYAGVLIEEKVYEGTDEENKADAEAAEAQQREAASIKKQQADADAEQKKAQQEAEKEAKEAEKQKKAEQKAKKEAKEEPKKKEKEEKEAAKEAKKKEKEAKEAAKEAKKKEKEAAKAQPKKKVIEAEAEAETKEAAKEAKKKEKEAEKEAAKEAKKKEKEAAKEAQKAEKKKEKEADKKKASPIASVKSEDSFDPEALGDIKERRLAQSKVGGPHPKQLCPQTRSFGKTDIEGRLALYGLEMVDDRYDQNGSNCLFSAFLNQLKQHGVIKDKDNKKTPETLRKKAVSWISKNLDYKLKYYGEMTVRDLINRDPAQYIKNMAKETTWGDDVALYALLTVYKVEVAVISTLKNNCELLLPPSEVGTPLARIFIGSVEEIHFVSSRLAPDFMC